MPSVTRRPSGDARERRVAAERQLLEAVERLLAGGESFTALGVQRIADEAGIGRSTFYGYFDDKTALLLRLVTSATDELFTRSAEWVRDDTSTVEQLAGVLLEVVREQRRHGDLLRALLEVAAYDPQVAAFWRGRVDGFADGLRRRIERDARAGRARAGIDARATAAWIGWGTERSIAVHVERSAPRSDPGFARAVAAAIWAAMGRAPQR